MATETYAALLMAVQYAREDWVTARVDAQDSPTARNKRSLRIAERRLQTARDALDRFERRRAA